jgi:hypothetical protein
VLCCQQNARFEPLQVAKRELRQGYPKFNLKWDLPEMLGQRGRSDGREFTI